MNNMSMCAGVIYYPAAQCIYFAELFEMPYVYLSPYYLTARSPALPELLRLRVPQKAGAHYSTFGILLLNDETGSRMANIENECYGRPERIVLKVLQEWLEGKGLMPVTWETLIKTLRNTELNLMADEIEIAKNIEHS